MIHAYRLTYPFSEYGPPQLWEWQQPYIDALVLHAKTFNRRVVSWWFEDWDALDQDNTRIWQTCYAPKPLSELYSGWQEMLAEGHEGVHNDTAMTRLQRPGCGARAGFSDKAVENPCTGVQGFG